jgi:hypothetical protein
MFVKPERERLRVLVRVPLQAFAQTQWPQRESGLLDLSQADRVMRAAAMTKIADGLKFFEDDRLLESPSIGAITVSLPSDYSFDSYERALAHTTGARLAADSDFVISQGLLDVLFEYAIRSDRSAFSVQPNFAHLGATVLTLLRFLPPDRPERALSIRNDPGLIRIDPRWFQAARRFTADGFFHMLGGLDYLLFLFCLIIPFRRPRSLLMIVTAFTAAHSITLIASAYYVAPDALWFRPLVEMLIAASIIYTALENIVSPGLRRRWIVAFASGLVYGFGFSFALRESLQFAGSHAEASILSFNIGLEIGQFLVLVVLVPALEVFFRFLLAERPGTIIMSVLVVHTSWHWLMDRYTAFSRYPIAMPVFDAAFYAAMLRWLMLLVIVAAVAWLIFGVFARGSQEPEARSQK